jgi:hypothetical protein
MTGLGGFEMMFTNTKGRTLQMVFNQKIKTVLLGFDFDFRQAAGSPKGRDAAGGSMRSTT